MKMLTLVFSSVLALGMATAFAEDAKPAADAKPAEAAAAAPAADAKPAMGTEAEAQALSEKATALVNEKGEEAFKVFSDKAGGFQEKDLYVFCMDMEGKMLSHAVKPELVGTNMKDFDKYGDKLFVNMIDMAKSAEGKGWVEYKWPYPGTEDLKAKKSYVMKNDKGFFCGVGAYVEEKK